MSAYRPSLGLGVDLGAFSSSSSYVDGIFALNSPSEPPASLFLADAASTKKALGELSSEGGGGTK